jgi:ribosome maturation factor RimP
MRNRPPTGPIADTIRELAEEMGYFLLECSHQHVKGRTHVHCVLHGPGGIDLDTLTTIHRALQPRLEATLDERDLRIEFSSPGVERTIKSFHELQAFVGRTAQVLPTDADEWLQGTLRTAESEACTFEMQDGTTTTFTPATLHKVRLAD